MIMECCLPANVHISSHFFAAGYVVKDTGSSSVGGCQFRIERTTWKENKCVGGSGIREPEKGRIMFLLVKCLRSVTIF